MRRLIVNLENESDIILLDSPTIVTVANASTISSEIDAFVLFVKARQSDRAAVDRTFETIVNAKMLLIGVILNGAYPETLSGTYSCYCSFSNYNYQV